MSPLQGKFHLANSQQIQELLLIKSLLFKEN
jgi:hypothetical protein